MTVILRECISQLSHLSLDVSPGKDYVLHNECLVNKDNAEAVSLSRLMADKLSVVCRLVIRYSGSNRDSLVSLINMLSS